MYGRRDVVARIAAVALALLLAGSAEAANRCTLTATGACSSYHATIQDSVDTAVIGDRVVVGAGLYVEDVYVTKKINATGQAGAVLNGEWHDDGVSGLREIRTITATLIRVTGGLSLKIINGAGCVLIDGAESTRVQGRTVAGCAVGIDLVDAVKPYISTVTAIANGIGIRITRGSSTSQVFFNTFEGNAVAVQLNAASHTDVNSNDVACQEGGVGFQMNVLAGAVNDTMEYNQNAFTGCAGQHWQIQQCDGAYTVDPTLSPEINAQYGTNTADGATLPVVNTGAGGC